MNEREKLSQLFEQAAQSLLEISRIMAKKSIEQKTLNKREYAIELSRIEREEKSKNILKDLDKPHPETNPNVLEMIRKAKEKIK